MKPYSGIMPAVVTPFKPDFQINEEAYINHINYLTGVDGVTSLLINGHTSEILSLMPEERAHLVKIARDALGPDYPIVAGVHGQCTSETVKSIQDAQLAGADAAIVYSPFSFGRGAFAYPSTVKDFYTTASNCSDLSIFIMQYPAYSGLTLPPDLMGELATVEKIIGVKEAVGDIVRYEQDFRMLRRIREDFVFLSAYEGALFATFSIGCDGAVIGIGNIPEPVAAMFAAVQGGDLNQARQVYEKFYPLSNAIYCLPSFRWSTRLKYALCKMGRIPDPTVREPLQPLTDAERKQIDEALQLFNS
jgi:4-hydroxy-tetrahydrodipicolinate synthase